MITMINVLYLRGTPRRMKAYMSSMHYATAWHTTVVELSWNCHRYYFLTYLSPWHLSTHDLVLQHSIPGHGKDLASSTVFLLMHWYLDDIHTFTTSTSLLIICFDLVFFLYFSLTIVSLKLDYNGHFWLYLHFVFFYPE